MNYRRLLKQVLKTLRAISKASPSKRDALILELIEAIEEAV